MTIIDDKQAYHFMSKICLLDAYLETLSINTHEVRIVVQANLDHLLTEYNLGKEAWRLSLVFKNPQKLEANVKQNVFANSLLVADPDPEADMANFTQEGLNVEKIGSRYQIGLEWSHGSISFDYELLSVEVLLPT